MSDALTDIERDNKNYRWMTENVEPLVRDWCDGKIDTTTTVQKLEKLLDEDIPHYRGYFSEPCTKQVVAIARDIVHRPEMVKSWFNDNRRR
jgi:hypothetical protein